MFGLTIMELILFGILLLLSTNSAQTIQDGQCDENIAVEQNFSIDDVNILIFNMRMFYLVYFFLISLNVNGN